MKKSPTSSLLYSQKHARNNQTIINVPGGRKPQAFFGACISVPTIAVNADISKLMAYKHLRELIRGHITGEDEYVITDAGKIAAIKRR